MSNEYEFWGTCSANDCFCDAFQNSLQADLKKKKEMKEIVAEKNRKAATVVSTTSDASSQICVRSRKEAIFRLFTSSLLTNHFS